jgi:hypothetical protein
MRSDPSYPDLAGPQLLVAGGSSHRLGNLRNALVEFRISNFTVFVTTSAFFCHLGGQRTPTNL